VIPWLRVGTATWYYSASAQERRREKIETARIEIGREHYQHERVLHEHADGHGPDTAGDRCDAGGHQFCLFEIHIAHLKDG
jgi:hypothetical protein